MLLYNITTIIEEQSTNDWLAWAQEYYIPNVMSTEKFLSHRLLKVLDSPNEGVTFCLQFIAENDEDYQIYLDVFAPDFDKAADEAFKGRCVTYRTLMEFL